MAEKASSRVFTKTIDGSEQTMVAHTAADAVRYQFDGWREVAEPADPAPAGKAGKTGK